MGRHRWIAFVLLFLMVMTMVVTAGGSDAVILKENSGNIMYSNNDVPILQIKDFIVPVEAKSEHGDTIYYRYETTDFDPSKHTVTLEVYYTDSWWGGGPYPEFEKRRDFHSGASHAGDIKIANDEYGWYAFVWVNEGSEKCTFDYTIGLKDSSSVELCFSTLTGIALIGIVCLVIVLRKR